MESPAAAPPAGTIPWFAGRAAPPRTDGARLPYLVLDTAPIGMAITDAYATVVWANRTLHDLLGAPADSLVGRPLGSLIHPGDAAGPADDAALLSGERTSVEREERWLAADGTPIWVLQRAVLAATVSGPSPDDAGPGEQWIVRQVLDIRARRQVEEALDDTRRELAERNTELERSNADLAEFAHVVSHDLSEPLRVIAGHVRLIEERLGDEVGEDARRWIDFAVDGCSRMRTLIDDLLAYSRAGRSDHATSTVDLAAVVSDACSGLAVATADARAVITVGPMPSVTGDRTQLGQVVTNLVANALKFRRPDMPPRIAVEARAVGGAWAVSVTDNGIGIPERHRQRIFGPFQRLHHREDYPGTGIGLAICRKLVERHGGRIWTEDAPSGGSTFTFTVPAAQEP